MTQHLSPVHKAIKMGIAKAQRAPKNKQRLAKANAWTSALFLLDGPEEQWWWLRLIRPVTHMDLPWKDSEDGGVAELHVAENGAEELTNKVAADPVAKDEPRPSQLQAGIYDHCIGLYDDGEDSGDEYMKLLEDVEEAPAYSSERPLTESENEDHADEEADLFPETLNEPPSFQGDDGVRSDDDDELGECPITKMRIKFGSVRQIPDRSSAASISLGQVRQVSR
jgi:hypothetical protein